MKLAVFSDVHGNLTALETVLADIDRHQPDKVWMLGDLAALGQRPNDCVTVLRERHEADPDHFKVIGGNTDRYLVTNARMSMPPAKDADGFQRLTQQSKIINVALDWAREKLSWENYEFLAKILHKEVGEKVAGYGYVLGYHAIPGNDEFNITDSTPDEAARDSVLDRPLRLGIYGHIHRQVNRDLGRVRLMNPGSVGLSFDNPGYAQYALLTFDNGAVNVQMRNLPYDIDAAIADAAENGHPAPPMLEALMRNGQ